MSPLSCALPALLLACLAPTCAAQGPSAWADLAPTAGVNAAAVRGQGKLVSYDAGETLHVFSSVTRRWHTVDKSPTATVTLFNDFVLVTDGARITALSCFDGRSAPLAASPAATVYNGANAKNDSIALVRDGSVLHAFSAFTGAWISRPLGANVAASVRRHVAVVHSGGQLWGMSAFDGRWRDTSAQAVTSLSAEGTAAFAVGAGLHAFSAHTRSWSRHAAIQNAAFARGHDWGLWRSTGSALAFSGLRGEFTELALAGALVAASSDLYCLLEAQGALHAYSAATGDAVVIGPTTASIDVGLATALLHVQSGVIGYSALRQQAALLPVARLASGAGADVGFVTDAGGQSFAWSSARGSGSPAPQATVGQAPLLTTTSLALQAADDCFAFDTTGGQFVPLGSAVAGLAGNADSAPLLAYDAAALHAFDVAQARWTSAPRTGAGAPTFRVWRTSALVVDGDSAHGFGVQPARWSSFHLGPHSSSTYANSEVAYLVESQRLLACSMLAEIVPFQQFPHFRRVQPRGAEVALRTAPLGNAAVLAGLGPRGVPTTLPNFGELHLDLGAAVVIAPDVDPITQTACIRITPPNSAALAGLEVFAQLFIAPPVGAPYVSGRASVQLW